MNQHEMRAVENRLIAMGLNGVNDPELCQVFARIVEDFPYDKHWFFRGMLNECEAHQRTEMYEAVKPHFIKFQPKSLETYLCEITEQACRMISHRVMRVEGRKPDAIQVGSDFYVSAADGEGSHTAVRFICIKCQKPRVFIGDTQVGAIIKARAKGWVFDPIRDSETCPKCPSPLRRIHHA